MLPGLGPTTFEAIFVVSPALRWDSECLVRNYFTAFELFKEPVHLPLKICSLEGLTSCSIRSDMLGDLLENDSSVGYFSRRPENLCLKFTTIGEFPGREKFDPREEGQERSDISDEDLPRIWKSVAPSFLEPDYYTFIFCINIAFPGSIRIADCVWYVDDERVHKPSSCYRSRIDEGFNYLEENGFFPDLDLTIEQVQTWVSKQNGIISGRSDTPGSRSLNYLTRLFSTDPREDEVSNLVWALAGIEALLVEQGRSSIGQLKAKLTAIFAGHDNIGWLLKSCDDMYSYRSKMVHGNRQIRSIFRDDDDFDEPWRQEEYESEKFAIGLLILLLRRLIYLNASSFNFKTILID